MVTVTTPRHGAMPLKDVAEGERRLTNPDIVIRLGLNAWIHVRMGAGGVLDPPFSP